MSLEISEVKGSYWLFSFLKRCNASSSSDCRDNWLRGMSPQLKAVMDGAPAPAAFVCQLAETSYTHWTTPHSVSLLNTISLHLSWLLIYSHLFLQYTESLATAVWDEKGGNQWWGADCVMWAGSLAHMQGWVAYFFRSMGFRGEMRCLPGFQ